jgi:hypothetical protein
LKTDASAVSVGDVLCQIHSEIKRPVAYASKKLSAAEANYSAIKQKLFAIFWCVNHFRPYLPNKPFTVVTEHKPLSFLCRLREPKGRRAHWLETLGEYKFTVEHRPGSCRADADALSRQQLPEHPSTVYAQSDN